jgi:hypothetical protein
MTHFCRNGKAPIRLAAGEGFPSIIEVFVTHGVDVNFNDNGFTLLHIAAKCDQPSCIEALIRLKADVDIRDRCACLFFIFLAVTAKFTPSFVVLVTLL